MGSQLESFDFLRVHQPWTLSRWTRNGQLLYLHKQLYPALIPHFFGFVIQMQWWDLLQRRVYQPFCFSCVKGFKVFFATVTEIDPELLFIFTVKILQGFTVPVFTKRAKDPFNRPWVPAKTTDQWSFTVVFEYRKYWRTSANGAIALQPRFILV